MWGRVGGGGPGIGEAGLGRVGAECLVARGVGERGRSVGCGKVRLEGGVEV